MKRIERIVALLTVVILSCVGVQPTCAEDFLIENSDGTYEYHYIIVNDTQCKVYIDQTKSSDPYQKTGNRISFNWGNKSVSLQQGDYPSILAGTVTDNTDGSVRRCEIVDSRSGTSNDLLKNPKRVNDVNLIWNTLSSNNHRRAFIVVKREGEKNLIAIPVMAKFIPVPWVDTEFRQCGLLSVTSDNPMFKELGNLSCAYSLRRSFVVGSKGDVADITIAKPDGSEEKIEFSTGYANNPRLDEYGRFSFDYPVRTVPGMGMVEIKLDIFF